LSTPNADPERKEATDKEISLSLSVSALVDLATAKNSYIRESDWMSTSISDRESAHGYQAGGWKKRSTLSH
jgi:hypothetical protein